MRLWHQDYHKWVRLGEILCWDNFPNHIPDEYACLHADESNLYPKVGTELACRDTVYHGNKEYVRGDVTTNAVEGFSGMFKRGVVGIYQASGEYHFQRYIDEFKFHFNSLTALGVNDTARAGLILAGTAGKRLPYRRLGEA